MQALRLSDVALMIAACTVSSLGGCGYRLAGSAGSTSFLPEDVTSIGVPPLANETDRPEIEQRITEALIDQFVRRGRYRVLPSGTGADVVLEGVIVAFRAEPVTFTEAGRFDRVEVVISSRIRLVRSSPEKVLWSQNHFSFREQYDVPETPLAEFDREIVAIEEISTDFARSVVTSILEGF